MLPGEHERVALGGLALTEQFDSDRLCIELGRVAALEDVAKGIEQSHTVVRGELQVKLRDAVVVAVGLDKESADVLQGQIPVLVLALSLVGILDLVKAAQVVAFVDVVAFDELVGRDSPNQVLAVLVDHVDQYRRAANFAGPGLHIEIIVAVQVLGQAGVAVIALVPIGGEDWRSGGVAWGHGVVLGISGDNVFITN